MEEEQERYQEFSWDDYYLNKSSDSLDEDYE